MKDFSLHTIQTETVQKTDCTFLAKCMPERYAKAMRYRREQDRLLCLGAGLLMMDVLGIRDEREICYGQYGKPYVPGKRAFSISHSGTICVLACGDAEQIGVDIEEINEQNVIVAETVFTEKELAWMKADPVERFFRLWTLKECIMKATGMGMQLEPKSFEVLPLVKNNPAQILGRTWYSWGERLAKSYISVCEAADTSIYKHQCL